MLCMLHIYVVITIFKNEGANIALRTLCENDILNAPVVDELNRYCGTIDMMQLLTFSLDIFTNEFRPRLIGDFNPFATPWFVCVLYI